MAKVLTPAPDDERVMKFVLMRLTFFEGSREGKEGVEQEGKRGGRDLFLGMWPSFGLGEL